MITNRSWATLVPKAVSLEASCQDKRSSVPQHDLQLSVTDADSVLLPASIIPAWALVFLDARPLFNSSHPDRPKWIYENQTLYFDRKVTGALRILCPTTDTWNGARLPVDHTQRGHHEQQADAYGVCRPVVVSLPQKGFVRIGVDLTSFEYVANLEASGTDAFVYKLVAPDGQESEPACAYIAIDSSGPGGTAGGGGFIPPGQ